MHPINIPSQPIHSIPPSNPPLYTYLITSSLALETKLAILEADRARDNTKIHDLETRLAAEKWAFTAKLAVMEKERDILRATGDAQGVRIAELEAQLRLARDNLVAVEARMAEFESQNAELKNKARDDATALTDLRTQLAKETATRNAGEKTIADLTAQGKSDKDAIERLKQQLAQMKDATDQHIAAMETQAKKDQNEMLAFKKQAADDKQNLEAKIAALEVQKKKDQDELATLKRQLADAQQALSVLTIKYNALDDQTRRDQVALAGLKASLDASDTSLVAGNKRIAELEGDQTPYQDCNTLYQDNHTFFCHHNISAQNNNKSPSVSQHPIGQSAKDNNTLAQLRKDLANTQSDLISTKEALNGSILENKRLMDEIARLNKALADVNATVAQRDTKLKEAEARASKDAADMAALKVRVCVRTAIDISKTSNIFN